MAERQAHRMAGRCGLQGMHGWMLCNASSLPLPLGHDSVACRITAIWPGLLHATGNGARAGVTSTTR